MKNAGLQQWNLFLMVYKSIFSVFTPACVSMRRQKSARQLSYNEVQLQWDSD